MLANLRRIFSQLPHNRSKDFEELNRFDMSQRSEIESVGRLSGFPLGGLLVDWEVISWFCKRFVEEFSVKAPEVEFDHSAAFEHSLKFWTVFLPSFPDKLMNQEGSNNLDSLFVLWFIVYVLHPSLIVESGVWIGSSLLTLRRACPSATVIGYDIDDNRLLVENGVTFKKCDWSLEPPSVARDKLSYPKSLVFFDDHISVTTRILEASEFGFDWAVVDDSPVIGTLSQYRFPALPILSALIDSEFPESFSAIYELNGEKLVFNSKVQDIRSIRGKIEAAYYLPEILRFSGIDIGDKWLLKIKPPG